MGQPSRENGQEVVEALVRGRCDYRQANLALWAAKGAAKGESEAEARKHLQWLNTRAAWLLENFKTDVAHLRSIGLWPEEWTDCNRSAGPAQRPCSGADESPEEGD